MQQLDNGFTCINKFVTVSECFIGFSFWWSVRSRLFYFSIKINAVMYAFKGKCFETFTVASGGCIWWWLVIVIEIVDQVTWGVVFNFLVIWTVSDAVMWCVSCWSMIGLKQRWFILGGGKRNEHSKNTPGRSGQYAYQGEWVIMTFCSKKIKATVTVWILFFLKWWCTDGELAPQVIWPWQTYYCKI